MKKKIFLAITLLFLATGCTANYTIEVFDGEIKEELYIFETDMSKANELDDMEMSFKDYAKEYGITNDYYTSYYNMYSDDEICIETASNDCRTYDKEYIEEDNKVGFKLSSTFSYQNYYDATIPNDSLPGFSSEFDGRYLKITGGSNWDFIKGYNNLEKVNIVIKSNYYVKSTNIKQASNGTYEITATNKNSSSKPSFYIIFDTLSTVPTNKPTSSDSKIVGIIMLAVIGIAIAIFGIRVFFKNKNNNYI